NSGDRNGFHHAIPDDTPGRWPFKPPRIIRNGTPVSSCVRWSLSTELPPLSLIRRSGRFSLRPRLTGQLGDVGRLQKIRFYMIANMAYRASHVRGGYGPGNPTTTPTLRAARPGPGFGSAIFSSARCAPRFVSINWQQTDGP